MKKRFVTIWFRYLKTDWLSRRHPELCDKPFVLTFPDHGRMIVTAVNPVAQQLGIHRGMVAADARALFPGLQVFDDKPGDTSELLKKFAEYCIRYTPVTAIDLPEGLILDASGCAHLWGGEENYLTAISNRFTSFGYRISIGMADTIGAAWAITHYSKNENIIPEGHHHISLLSLPPAALRLEEKTIELLYKLGLKQISRFISMPAPALKRRFGNQLVQRIDQALGLEEEMIEAVFIPEPFHERLPCPEGIVSATGIEIALKQLLDTLCTRLQKEQKGVRKLHFKCFRIDGKMQSVEIGTHRSTHRVSHLFKLFEQKLSGIEPGLGIELFVLEANVVEPLVPAQEKIWKGSGGLTELPVSELIDRISNKIGAGHIRRYLPAEHHWPERSVRTASDLLEEAVLDWRTDKQRPLQLLARPERIEVTAPIPDYPPMLFRYKEKLHKIVKADGPERIEREWWIEKGPHRDYYSVEDEEGNRYWLYRLGHYSTEKKVEWYLHGFFG